MSAQRYFYNTRVFNGNRTCLLHKRIHKFLGKVDSSQQMKPLVQRSLKLQHLIIPGPTQFHCRSAKDVYRAHLLELYDSDSFFSNEVIKRLQAMKLQLPGKAFLKLMETLVAIFQVFLTSKENKNQKIWKQLKHKRQPLKERGVGSNNSLKMMCHTRKDSQMYDEKADIPKIHSSTQERENRDFNMQTTYLKHSAFMKFESCVDNIEYVRTEKPLCSIRHQLKTDSRSRLKSSHKGDNCPIIPHKNFEMNQNLIICTTMKGSDKVQGSDRLDFEFKKPSSKGGHSKGNKRHRIESDQIQTMQKKKARIC